MEFRILGPLEVIEGGTARPLGGTKQRAVLAILILHRGELLTGERLIDELWEEHPPATAAKTLQGYISRLRKVLGEDVLVTRGRGYVLGLPTETLDLDRFDRLAAEGRDALGAGDPAAAARRLRDALSMWRGPPLADLAYEPFAQPEIARLEESRLAAVEDRIDADLALGRHGQVVAELEALVREHALRERLRGQLMLALYRSGRQADALDCYRAGRRALVDELGIEPARALVELEAAILRQDAELDAPGGGGVQPPAAENGRPRPAPVDPTSAAELLIGRGAQVDELRSGLDAAFAGEGAVFMVGGESGIGKTRLADELAREARAREAGVVWGRCWEAGGAPAYWPWVQVLRGLVQSREDADLGSRAGAGAESLSALIPERPDAAAGGTDLSPESEGARFHLFDAVAALLRDSARARPVLVVLDDLHAADTPSLLLLRFLAGQLADARVMVTGLYRDDDPGRDTPLSACLAALARERTTHRMHLAGLRVDDTAAMIEEITGRRVAVSIVRRIHAETEGNPLFVGEIVRLLEAEGGLERSREESGFPQLPETVREVIGQRLRRLTPASRRLLSAASVLGREFGVRELAAVADVDPAGMLEAIDEAIAARVLAEAPAVGRIRFAHALIRETLYEALSGSRRRGTHLRAGEILEGLYASAPEAHLAELAYHFCEALPSGDPRRAVDYARRAGDHATELLAYEEAARLFELALRSLDVEVDERDERRCDLLVALGDAWARAGDEPAAKDAFLQAAVLAARTGLAIQQAQAALGYGGRFVWSRAYGDTHLIPLLEDALAVVPADAPALRVRLMARLSGALRDHPSRERRASLSAQAVEIARALGDPATLAYALDGHYAAIMWPETAERRVAIADEIVALARQVGDGERATAGRLYRMLANMELGRMTAGESELKVVAEEGAALRQPAQLWVAAATGAAIALFHGRFVEARHLIDEALALGERAQRRDAVLSHRLQRFMLDRETGGSAETAALIEDGVVQFPRRPVFRCALACLHADRGETDRAQATLDELAARDFEAIQRDNEYLFSVTLLADVIDAVADLRAAAVLYDLAIPFAHLNAMNSDEMGLGSMERTLGVLAAATSRYDDAARHFRAAIAHNTEMGAWPWVAHSRHDLARMLLLHGDPGDREQAHELLNAARAEYERLGMAPWVARTAELAGSETTAGRA